MADVMVLYKPLDRHIDIYRHDEDLTVEVPFEEYLNFITYVLETKKFLFSDSAKLKRLLRSYVTTHSRVDHMELQVNHVLDVMSAAAKELYLAESRGKLATNISFSPQPECEVLLMNAEIGDYDKEKHREFYRRLDLLGYKFPTGYNSKHNKIIGDKISLTVKAALRSNFKPFILLG
jgi:hypothetical protein